MVLRVPRLRDYILPEKGPLGAYGNISTDFKTA